MIIGAQKAGTTSLKNYLSQHPHIESHFQTEFSYFTDPEEYAKGYDFAFTKYISNKDLPSDIRIVAKNAVNYASDKDLQLLYNHNPEAILVLILRNPVERAYSSYNMEKTFNADWMEMNFSGLIRILEQKDYDNLFYKLFIKMGLYADYLEMVYKYFPKNQVKVILFEEMQQDPLKVCRELFSALGVSTSYVPDVTVIHNKTAKTRSRTVGKFLDWLRDNDNYFKRFAKMILPHDTFVNLSYKLIELNKSKSKKIAPLDPEVRIKLEDYYRPYNQRLEKLTGIDISIWDPKIKQTEISGILSLMVLSVSII